MPALPVTVIFVVNAVAALGSTSLEPLSNTYVLQWVRQLFVKRDIILACSKNVAKNAVLGSTPYSRVNKKML